MISRLASEVETDLAGRPALLRDACSRALAYLGGLGDRPVAPAAAEVAALDRLDFALPGAGQDAASVLALLDDYGSPGTVASGGPRYFGFVTGGALPIAPDRPLPARSTCGLLGRRLQNREKRPRSWNRGRSGGPEAQWRDGGVAATALFAGPGASTLADTTCQEGLVEWQ